MRDEFPAYCQRKARAFSSRRVEMTAMEFRKVELVAPAARNVRVVEASDGVYSETSRSFSDECEAYFGQDGFIVDQPFQDR